MANYQAIDGGLDWGFSASPGALFRIIPLGLEGGACASGLGGPIGAEQPMVRRVGTFFARPLALC